MWIALAVAVVLAAVGALTWWLAGREDPRPAGAYDTYQRAEADRRLGDNPPPMADGGRTGV